MKQIHIAIAVGVPVIQSFLKTRPHWGKFSNKTSRPGKSPGCLIVVRQLCLHGVDGWSLIELEARRAS